MLTTFRSIVGIFASVSVFIACVTYYLSWNKTWRVKHEVQVAASISMASYVIYLLPQFFTTTNVFLDTYMGEGSWQTAAEYVLNVINTVFFIMVGVGWWVAGERRKGFFKLLTSSLRSESKHLGDLAKAMLHPAAAGKMVDILTGLAMIDDNLDAKEKAFIQTFAKAWGVEVDWDSVTARAHAAGEARYVQIRKDVNDYLATTPPPEQALQLADIVGRLVAADENTSPEEELIASELTGLLERYGGKAGQTVYELHLVPQSAEQLASLESTFPDFETRALASGPVMIAGAYFSRRYAELIQQQYESLNFYTAIKTAAPAA